MSLCMIFSSVFIAANKNHLVMINSSHLGTKLTFSGIQEANNVVLHIIFSIFIFLQLLISFELQEMLWKKILFELFTMIYLE